MKTWAEIIKKPKYDGEITSSQLETLINTAYHLGPGTYYEVVADMEWANDSTYPIRVQKGELYAWDQKHVDAVKAGRSLGYSLNYLLKDLANRDLVAPGRYLVVVSW